MSSLCDEVIRDRNKDILAMDLIYDKDKEGVYVCRGLGSCSKGQTLSLPKKWLKQKVQLYMKSTALGKAFVHSR